MADPQSPLTVFSHLAVVVDNLQVFWESCQASGVEKTSTVVRSGPVRGTLEAPAYGGYGEERRTLVMRIEITALVEKPEPSIAVEPDPPEELKKFVAAIPRSGTWSATPSIAVEPNVVVDQPEGAAV